jgi:hypothetical protein
LETNVALPFNAWQDPGAAVESPAGSGLFHFTDPQATNHTERFDRVRSPQAGTGGDGEGEGGRMLADESDRRLRSKADLTARRNGEGMQVELAARVTLDARSG